MSNNEQSDQLKQLLEVCSQSEAAEIKVLHNAQIQTLKAYQNDPTIQRKKDWDAAKGGYEEAENRLWIKYFSEDENQDADPEANASETLIVTTTTASVFFQVSRKTLAEWKKIGCPQVARGQWDLKKVFDWWWNMIASERAAAQSGDESLNEAKRQYWWSKAEEGQIKVSQAREDLIDKDAVHKQWAQRMAEFKNGCFGLINQLPPLLEGKTQSEMRKVIEDYVWGMFKRITRYGKFCKQQQQMKQKSKSRGTKKK